MGTGAFATCGLSRPDPLQFSARSGRERGARGEGQTQAVPQGETADEAFENMGAAVRFALRFVVEEAEDVPPSDASVFGEIRNVEPTV